MPYGHRGCMVHCELTSTCLRTTLGSPPRRRVRRSAPHNDGDMEVQSGTCAVDVIRKKVLLPVI